MRTFSRWVGLGLAGLCVCVMSAGCGGATPGKTQQHPAATATAIPPTPTASPRPAQANVYYQTEDQTVYALNPANGSVRWTFSHGVGVINPIAAGSLVYVETGLGQAETLFALDAGTGAIVWSAPGGMSPTVATGAVYMILSGHTVECLDALTGKAQWQRQVQGEQLTTASDALYVWHLYRASMGAVPDSSLTALDPTTGVVRWNFTRSQEALDYPIAGDGAVYVEAYGSQPSYTTSGQLYALKAADGSQLWSANAPSIANTFALGGGVLYVGGSTTGVSAYRVADGTLLWKNTDQQLSRFTADGNAVYVNTFHDTVVALDAASGKQLWSVSANRSAYSYAPFVVNGLLYAVEGRGSGAMVAININSGAIAWQQPITGTPGPPIVADGVLYTYDMQPENGPSPAVYAFNATTGSALWQHKTGKNLETTLAVNDGQSGA